MHVAVVCFLTHSFDSATTTVPDGKTGVSVFSWNFFFPFGAVQTKSSRDPFHYGANSLNFHLKLPVTHLSTQPVEHLPGTLNDLFVCTLCQ